MENASRQPSGDRGSGLAWRLLAAVAAACSTLRDAIRDFEYHDHSPYAVLLHRACLGIGWILYAIAAWYVWQTLGGIIGTLVPRPPPPSVIDESLRRAALFNILGLVIAGPILLFFTYAALKAIWVILDQFMKAPLPLIFQSLTAPVLALLLSLAASQAIPQLAQGFWGSYHWLERTFEDAADWSLTGDG